MNPAGIMALRQGMLVLICMTLMVACKKDDDDKGPVPVADFTISGGSCLAPCEVTMTNLSANATSYTWDFGDGSPVSNEATSTVTHTYQQAGSYTIKLTAKGETGKTGSKALAVVVNSQHSSEVWLTNGAWKLANVEIDSSGQLISLWPNVAACNKDDKYEYLSNGTFKYHDTGLRCQGYDSLYTSTWRFNHDKSNLIVGLDTYLIRSLDANTLRFIQRNKLIISYTHY